MGGMDSEYLPLHAPTGPHPLRAFPPQVLTFMTRHGQAQHSFFAVRFAVSLGRHRCSRGAAAEVQQREVQQRL